MAFWKTNSVDPVRQFRFKVLGPGGEWWWVKNIDKPSFEINTNEYQLANQKFKFPGILTWNDITVTILDVGKKANEILNIFMKKQGYQSPDACNTGLSKVFQGTGKEQGDLNILQYDSTGKVIETWDLYGSFIKSVDFGTLDYSGDEIVEIKIVITYDYAEMSTRLGVQTTEDTPQGTGVSISFGRADAVTPEQ